MDIEAAIAAHPDVADVAVTAVPDARLGEAAGAWLVLRLGAVWAGPAPIIEHLEQRKLARQKIPVQWHVVAAIPTTASGKVQKNRLTELEDVAR
jgi:acyl-CoA synthetase (AMP-forming)/AMP-acid ligase II